MPENKPNGSLTEFAEGVNQLNRELQRQSDSYGHFRNMLDVLDSIAAGRKINALLPFITVNFPRTTEPTPGQVKVDLNVLPPVTQLAYKPMFEQLADEAGDALLSCWENLIELCNKAAPIVARARDAQLAGEDD